MGARSGGGGGAAMGRGWDSSAAGYKSAPFKGAAKAGSLKPGDKVQMQNGRTLTVQHVTSSGKNTVDIVMNSGSKIGGGIFATTYNKNGYIAAKKV